MFVDGGQRRLKGTPASPARNFTEDETEWKGTAIVFEISRNGEKTELRFAHPGLVPEYECFEVCSNAWGSYIHGSLRSLITTGKGKPNPKE
jgi:hypothetical protein